MRAARAIALAAALIGASCGAPLATLPAASGVPAADAATALAEATAACRRITGFSAEVGVSGSVSGRRMRGRVLVGLAAPAVVYLEAPAPFGAPFFIFFAREGRGTVLLPRDRRLLEGADPLELLEAVTGVPLEPADLRSTLTGCAPEQQYDAAGAVAPAEGWRVIRGESVLYLRRERVAGPWRLVAVVRDGPAGWRADYRDVVDEVPRRIRLTGVGERRFDLRLELSQVDREAALDPDRLRPTIPPDTLPISLEELRANGPLAE